ncbi:uncharacterized protein LOC135124400 [Zophobas morio]|uniref:uncharacterized protein LOC135124400 n=1 Tax=Zophobas morio TaxID=2755281 RepID=UPI003082F058
METNPIQVVVLGPPDAGKTCIIKRYVENSFNDNVAVTLGCDLYTCELVINDFILKLHIWVTAGQERFYSIVPLHYRDTKVVLFVFDITSQESFKSMQNWVEEVNNRVSPMVLCVSKPITTLKV